MHISIFLEIRLTNENDYSISRNMQKTQLASLKTEDAAARLEALGNPTRLSVYRLLVRAGDEGLTVGQLQKKLDIAASTLSHHLRSLIDVDLVRQERLGTTLMCRANYKVMTTLVSFLVDECCADVTSCRPAERVA